MVDRVGEQVLDYLLGALDDSEMEAVQARLESDPDYQRALHRAQHDLAWLRGMRQEISPPPRLAERTCQFLFDPARRLHAAVLWRRSMTPSPATPHCDRRVSWVDAGVAAVIFVTAGLLVLPAVNAMRFQARVAACQDNLRQVGQALTEYSHKNHEVFPVVPAAGNLAGR